MSETITTTAPPVDQIDIGRATIPKGTTVYVGKADHDPAFSGTLLGVDYRDGAAFTASVWTGQKVRHVYVERIDRWVES